MALYRVCRDYTSSIGQFTAGSEIDLDPEVAAHVERDSAGTLEPVDATKPQVRDIEPSEDRMQRPRGRRKRGE